MSHLARPILGFDRKQDAIRHLHAQGLGIHTIANDVGSDVGSVATQLSRMGLRPNRQSTHSSGSRPYLFLELPQDLVPLLRPHAARRGLSCAALAARIVDTVVASALVDATLDDRED